MRIVKLGLISIIIFGIFIFLFSLLFPSEVRISRAINITAPPQKVIAKLSDIKQWRHWNEMTNNPALEDGKYSDSIFSSRKMDVRLVSSANNIIKTEWRWGKRLLHSGHSVLQSQDSTILQWYFDIKLAWYPWEKFGSIVFDKQLGPSMEKSLTNFKNYVENNP